MAGKPLSEIVLTIVYMIQLFFLGNALYISIDRFVGWGDVIALIFLMGQWFLLLITLPFLAKGVKRIDEDSWFNKLIRIIIGLPLILTALILYVMQTHDVGTPVLTVVAMGINLIPIGLWYYYSKSDLSRD